MPQFPEKESSLLAKLKKSKPRVEELENQVVEKKTRPQAIINNGAAGNKLVDVSGSSANTSDPLAEVFASNLNPAPISIVNDENLEIENKEDIYKFVIRLAGVIYEDSVIQIGYKLEAKTHLARLILFYGNKTKAPFQNFQTLVTCPNDLAVQLLTQVKPIDPTINSADQVQQVVHFVCVNDFYTLPVARVSFNYT